MSSRSEIEHCHCYYNWTLVFFLKWEVTPSQHNQNHFFPFNSVKNQCGSNNGGCEHLCLAAPKTNGSSSHKDLYSCRCSDGYRLHDNHRNCIKLGEFTSLSCFFETAVEYVEIQDISFQLKRSSWWVLPNCHNMQIQTIEFYKTHFKAVLPLVKANLGLSRKEFQLPLIHSLPFPDSVV